MSGTTDQKKTPEPAVDPRRVAEKAAADFKQGADTMARVNEEAISHGRATMAAYQESSRVLFSGMQDIFKQMAKSGEAAMSNAMTGMREIASAGTLRERMERQANLMHTMSTNAVDDYSELAHANIELVGKVRAPLRDRMIASFETMSAKAS